MLDVDKTLGQTRSGTGDTHTLGQVLPRIRTLDGCLSCCPQARLRTLPGCLGKRGKEGLHVEMSRQKCRVQVALHRANATGALVPTLRERLLEVSATAMTILRQFGALGRDFDQDAARACNGASEQCYEHPWCTESHAAAILALPGAVRDFLGDDRVADRHDGMGQLAMQALALGGEFPFLVGQAPPGRLIAPAVIPGLAAFLAAALLVIVLWVVGAALAVQLALQTPFRLRIGC